MDNSDKLYNLGIRLDFFHIPSHKSVKFKAFLTTYADSFITNWEKESVIGRNDPYQNFKNTERTINLGWTLVAQDEQEARENLMRASNLAQFVYPSYTGAGATSLAASPVFRLKFLNLIRDASVDLGPQASAHDSGLPGIVNGFVFTPNLDSGFFMVNGSLYPKDIACTCQFTALHAHTLGWKKRKFGTAFPYGEKTDIPDKAGEAGGGTLWDTGDQIEAKMVAAQDKIDNLSNSNKDGTDAMFEAADKTLTEGFSKLK